MAPAGILQAGDAATWVNRKGQSNALTDAAFDAFYLSASLHPFVNPAPSFVNRAESLQTFARKRMHYRQ